MRPSSRIQIWILACLFITGSALSGTRTHPEVGQRIPSFTLANVHHYASKTFNPMDVKGKWIVMDFWASSCHSCIQAFPKMSKLQAEFKDDIQFLLVGMNDKVYNKNIESAFEVYRERMKLDIAIAYDTTLFSLFEVRNVPFAVIIDPSKNIYGFTYGTSLTSALLHDLVANKGPEFPKYAPYQDEKGSQAIIGIPFNKWSDHMTDEQINKRDFLFRSLLAPGDGYRANTLDNYSFEQSALRGYYQVTGATVDELFKMAYFGESYWGHGQRPGEGIYFTTYAKVIIESIDSSMLTRFSKNPVLYNYGLGVPKEKSSKEYFMGVMQNDLKKYFPYHVSIEKRLVPCWVLTATQEGRKSLPTKSSQYSGDVGIAGIKDGKHIDIEFILSLIEGYIDNHDQAPFIDETGIEGPIDINLVTALTSMTEVQKELAKSGLTLKKVEREFKVLVIRDTKL